MPKTRYSLSHAETKENCVTGRRNVVLGNLLPNGNLQTVPNSLHMAYESEWLTRKRRIDSRLKDTGWDIVRFSQDMPVNTLDRVAVEELPTANGPADYGLFVAGRLVGIVEAKSLA